MAYDFIIYARREAIPSADQFAATLATAAPRIALVGRLPDPAARSGSLAARIDGREISLGVLYGTIEPSEAAEFEADVAADGETMTAGNAQHFEILRTCDRTITLNGQSTDEIEAAGLIAAKLATASGGYLCDPQTNSVIGPPSPT